MALTPMNIIKKGSSSGASVGSVIGGALGGIVGTIVPGIGTTAGLAAGSAAGGAIGAVAAPGKAASQGFQGDQSAIARRADQQPDEQDHSQILEQSLAALKDAPPEIAKAYEDPLKKALEMSRRGIA
jgi:phage tail tape-measure protein